LGPLPLPARRLRRARLGAAPATPRESGNHPSRPAPNEPEEPPSPGRSDHRLALQRLATRPVHLTPSTGARPAPRSSNRSSTPGSDRCAQHGRTIDTLAGRHSVASCGLKRSGRPRAAAALQRRAYR
jgi:hypothetical protein